MRNSLLSLVGLCVILGLARELRAQIGADTTHRPAAPTHFKLPPSLEAELRRRGEPIRRAIIFHDTLTAQQRERAALNDTATTQTIFADSSLTVIDSAVALTHKQVLDSQLVELPELVRFGEKVHFNYPLSMMVETDRRPVPFDSSLVNGMNPISRVNLPFFDQGPMPLPMPMASPTEAFIEAGVGTPYLPFLSGGWSHTMNERLTMHAGMDFSRWMYEPISEFWRLGAGMDYGSGAETDQYSNRYWPSTRVDLSGMGKGVILYNGIGSGFLVRSTDVGLELQFPWMLDTVWGYEFSMKVHDYFNDRPSSRSEFSSEFDFSTLIHPLQLWNSEYVLTIGGKLETSEGVLLNDFLTFGHHTGSMVEWDLGVRSTTGSVGGTSSHFSPIARLRFAMNPSWTIGATFDPESSLDTRRTLAVINPFLIVNAPYGARSEILNFAAYTNYQLSPDDEVRASVRYVTTDNEVVFHAVEDSTGHATFYTRQQSTKRLTISASGNALLFTKDVASFSLDVRSVTSEEGVPFEPTFDMTLRYAFHSLFAGVQPVLELRHLARQDRAITLLNLSVRADVGKNLSILCSGENLLGSAGDFWTGYNEYPRAVKASLRYTW